MSHLSALPNLGTTDVAVIVVSLFTFYALVRNFRNGPVPTPLKGPSSYNFLFGMLPYLMKAPDAGAIYEGWAAQYGAVYSIPSVLGRRKIILTDPKALAHFFSRETYGYVATPQGRRFAEKLIGRGLFYAEGDSHKRQRRALNPAFSNASVRNLTPIFFDSAYKAKAAWDTILEPGLSEGTIIEVQQWMNHISLDTIGLAGFSHDFHTLSGQTSAIAEAFDSVGSKASLFENALFLGSLILPILEFIPTARGAMRERLAKTMRDLGETFLANSGASDSTADKSIIGLLVKSASSEKISQEEVVAQINVLLLAGYETTSISLTWALIELSRNPEMQTKLRDELLKLGGDPTWDDLTSHTTFLDAVTSEILRLHPPSPETQRMAAEDDILPLSTPLESASGAEVNTLVVRKGSVLLIPFESINRSEAFWGPDAKAFNPARWLDDSADQLRAREIQGHRHILTFSDGARICLGKTFALAEFKAVLSVLVRNYTFELPKGPETPIGRHRNLLPRPKVEGEDGYAVPLRVRQYVPA
ncbi:cytochrome P450 [Mycena filopes]|nr:cytochrome P450 [Mycena filopes]